MTERRVILPSLFFLSGMCGLVYQVVWTRWLGLIFGNFLTATAVVLAIFMIGLAAGAAIAGKYVSRLTPARAVTLYGILELALAVLAALSPLRFGHSSGVYLFMTGHMPLSVVRVFLSLVLVGIPAALMGATLPALVRALKAASPRYLGPLYALNTLGAAAGPLLAAFLLMPKMGMTNTILVTAALNAGVAGAALLLARRWPKEEGAADPAPVPAPIQSDAVPLMLGCGSGLLALASEVALTRQFQLLITGSSVYALASVLSSFLLGIGLGAAVLRRFPPRSSAQALGGYAIALGVVYLFSLTTPFWHQIPLLLLNTWAAGDVFAQRASLNFLVVFLLVVAPAAAFGYALPSLIAAFKKPDPQSVGRLFALNTVGAAAGALGIAFIVLPRLGLNVTLLAIGAAALVLALVALMFATRGGKRLALAAAAVPLLALPFLLPAPDSRLLNAGIHDRPGTFVSTPEKTRPPILEEIHQRGRIIFEADGYFGHIAVRHIPGKGAAFIVNGKPDGSSFSADLDTQIASAHIAMLLHPDPRSVFVIGLGTGITAGSLSLHSGVREIHVSEIEPVQVDVARIFSNDNYAVLENPKVHIHLDDARHLLAVQDRQYDVIISEPTNLFVSGMVNLYTREFFTQVRTRLKDGGIFLTWIQNYRVGQDDLKGMFRTFHEVFPEASLWTRMPADSYLVGVKGQLTIDYAEWQRRGGTPRIMRDLSRIGLRWPESLFGHYLVGPKAFPELAAGGRICTDDNPYLEFTSARVPLDHQPPALGITAAAPLPLKSETDRVRTHLGRLFLARGSKVRAWFELTRAVELNPASPAIHLLRKHFPKQ